MDLLKLFAEPGMVALTPREAAAVREALDTALATSIALAETRAQVSGLQAQVERLSSAADAAKDAREEAVFYTHRCQELMFRCREYELLIHKMLGEQSGEAYISGVKSVAVEEYAEWKEF